ncbi:hypothetical protein CYMTET_49915 [Cymbomonas tetramitiformis]|uniref:Uncharacterized protein n=1 Tax=Cymbomonas tetramitiformis TaxID=36881 RepID=A0AAE0ETE5_9CHLO|nr:hypothetical protein CYMTET_49915 [Cymbomonas tetramitiformis]
MEVNSESTEIKGNADDKQATQIVKPPKSFKLVLQTSARGKDDHLSHQGEDGSAQTEKEKESDFYFDVDSSVKFEEIEKMAHDLLGLEKGRWDVKRRGKPGTYHMLEAEIIHLFLVNPTWEPFIEEYSSRLRHITSDEEWGLYTEGYPLGREDRCKRSVWFSAVRLKTAMSILEEFRAPPEAEDEPENPALTKKKSNFERKQLTQRPSTESAIRRPPGHIEGPRSPAPAAEPAERSGMSMKVESMMRTNKMAKLRHAMKDAMDDTDTRQRELKQRMAAILNKETGNPWEGKEIELAGSVLVKEERLKSTPKLEKALQLLERGSHGLWELAVDRENHGSAIFDHLVLTLLLAVLESVSLPAVANALAAFWALAVSQECRNTLCSLNVLPAILSTLDDKLAPHEALDDSLQDDLRKMPSFRSTETDVYRVHVMAMVALSVMVCDAKCRRALMDEDPAFSKIMDLSLDYGRKRKVMEVEDWTSKNPEKMGVPDNDLSPDSKWILQFPDAACIAAQILCTTMTRDAECRIKFAESNGLKRLPEMLVSEHQMIQFCAVNMLAAYSRDDASLEALGNIEDLPAILDKLMYVLMRCTHALKAASSGNAVPVDPDSRGIAPSAPDGTGAAHGLAG